jgi:hypothetical protein
MAESSSSSLLATFLLAMLVSALVTLALDTRAHRTSSDAASIYVPWAAEPKHERKPPAGRWIGGTENVIDARGSGIEFVATPDKIDKKP